MLLEAAVLVATTMQSRGFLNRVVDATELAESAMQTVNRILALAPQAARLNKQTFRQFYMKNQPVDGVNIAYDAINTIAPHEVLLVIDGNTGQNALMQVKAFDEALSLTGLIVTKLDGTAKGGVLAAIALWGSQRAAGAVPVYFVGVGEKVEDLETFNAQEFAQALLA